MPRLLRVYAPALLLLFTAGGLIAGLLIGGAGAPRELLDPGTFVRFGMPFARTLVNLCCAGLIGSLVMAVWALSPKKPEFGVAMDTAAAFAAGLAVASALTLIMTFVDVSGLAFSPDEQFGAALAQFVTEIELGMLWLFSVALAAVLSVLCFAVRDRRWLLLVLVLSLVTLVPLASQGHAAGASGHSQAVNSLLVHLIGASVWLGGLMVLVMIGRTVDRARLAELTSRYSSLALLAFFGVSASGIVSAALRVGSLESLFGTGYGMLIIGKTLALLALGVFGALQRQWLIPRINRPGSLGARAFWWLVLAEVAMMGIASGLAGALGRSETPVSLEPLRDAGSGVSPAEWLTGDPLPPELSASSFLTVWKFDLAWVLICLFGAGFYLLAVIRLRRRGDRWPVQRTVFWILGLIVLFYTTNGALNAYEAYLFSIHMLGHMFLMMLIPILLVLGAPMTLLLRSVRKRNDGSWGAREWVMWGIQTPWSKLVTNPIVAAIIFAGSLWIFYYTPLFRWAAEDHLGHQWMIIHFLISGYLFSLSLIGVDPVPKRFPYPIRLVTLLATMGFHAFFGVTIMSSTGLLLADWYGAMGRTWGAPPLEDQITGGGIAWGIGELPTLMLAIIVAVMWSRSDARESKRSDRAADRSGEAELEAYNEMLQQMRSRDQKIEDRHGR